MNNSQQLESIYSDECFVKSVDLNTKKIIEDIPEAEFRIALQRCRGLDLLALKISFFVAGGLVSRAIDNGIDVENTNWLDHRIDLQEIGESINNSSVANAGSNVVDILEMIEKADGYIDKMTGDNDGSLAMEIAGNIFDIIDFD